MFLLIAGYIFEAVVGIFLSGSGAIIVYIINLWEKTGRNEIEEANNNKRNEPEEIRQFRLKYAKEDLAHVLKNKILGMTMGCTLLIMGILLMVNLVYRILT